MGLMLMRERTPQLESMLVWVQTPQSEPTPAPAWTLQRVDSSEPLRKFSMQPPTSIPLRKPRECSQQQRLRLRLASVGRGLRKFVQGDFRPGSTHPVEYPIDKFVAQLESSHREEQHVYVHIAPILLDR